MDTKLCLVIDTKEYKFIVKQRELTFPFHTQFVVAKDRITWKMG